MEEIVSARVDDGKHLFYVKWQDADISEWVSADDADICCPRKVIAFYEKHIRWANPTPVAAEETTLS